jgi:RNA polymerase sigma-70 factor, ECF subfamily
MITRDQTINNDLNVLSDMDLVTLVRQGQRKAFSVLVKRYQKPLLRLSLRFVKELSKAEDVVQESLIKAYEKLNSFEGRASFKSWLFQITVNTAKNKLRENRHDATDIENTHLSVAPIAESSLVNNAVSKLLQDEVEKLPAKQKTALVLRIYEDLSFQEIAEIMDCPYDTAKANYRHALLKIRTAIESQEDMRVWSADLGNFFTEITHRVVEAE